MNSVTVAVAAVVTDAAGRVLLCRQHQGRRRWSLPGGRMRRTEDPVRAAVRDVRAETGVEAEIVDLLGLYRLSGDPDASTRPEPGRPAPPSDVLVYVFRGRTRDADAAVARPCGSCPDWHDPHHPPSPLTPTTRTALADALAGRAGVIRSLSREPGPSAP